MTMHLIRGISSLSVRKPQVKKTKAKEASWREDHTIYNRELKRQGRPQLSWQEYMDMRTGKTKINVEAFKPLSANNYHPRYVDRTHIPSLNTLGNSLSCAKKEPTMYTGTLVKGIATMHKSNAVPVIDEDQMKEISRMRRG